MNVMNFISNEMKKFANKKYILPLLFLLIIILVFMECGPFGTAQLKAMSGGIGMLDMKFGYDATFVYDFLERIGLYGRLLYIKLLRLDYLFSIVYMSFQALLITALIKKAKLSVKWEKLNLIPILRTGLDIVENCLLLLIIQSFPSQYVVVITISSAVTILKLLVNYGYIGMVFTLGALTTRQTVLFKSKKQKMKEMREIV